MIRRIAAGVSRVYWARRGIALSHRCRSPMRTAPPDLARSALDAAPDAMIIIDAAGVILFTNQQVSALFGYAHDEIIGRSVEILMPERFRGRHIAHRENYAGSVRVRPMGAGLDLFGRRR